MDTVVDMLRRFERQFTGLLSPDEDWSNLNDAAALCVMVGGDRDGQPNVTPE